MYVLKKGQVPHLVKTSPLLGMNGDEGIGYWKHQQSILGFLLAKQYHITVQKLLSIQNSSEI